ncbi:MULTISPECIES: TerC family protein [Rubrivivax]|uniref:TerC family protein n=1 Tax=Rubrivivax benzoatilyticus TaxID=316997 RepID=A0ABX0HXW9_9BURK|nr:MULTISPECIES: TerC family protein [Rubrivivax]EGJ11348.1 membrane protein [Rubrivivax benzoatilyticus JA2 = ATCC BAA-35]MCC9596688.1 TerC family protein [Rubrivivax sp. JA1055]MCC9648845.1 TerC family protein [Rubrivivax sp. JA1029]NHK98682.1 TerC family protein [Rubrivivax benzoatilyticus]NHL24184.1 TerC family protein [Rubrivivax benzoatilyticus]
MEITTAAFWAALGSIIWVNVLLSGDNAVVIALAARALPAHQQKKAIFWGSAAAIVMRIVLTIVAARLLQLPFLKIVGALALLYIGVDLLLEDDEGGDQGANEGQGNILSAIRTILVADLVMSLDNVLAVAAAANGDVPLLVIGLAVSIPLIIFGSTLLLRVMERYPLIVTAGAALLGFLAGEMLMTDPAVVERFGELPHALINTVGALGAALVVGLGTLLQRRAAARRAAE